MKGGSAVAAEAALHEDLIRMASDRHCGDGRRLQRIIRNIDATADAEPSGGPWLELADVPLLDASQLGEQSIAPPYYSSPPEAYASSNVLSRLALTAQLALERAPPAVWGQTEDAVVKAASCFNWALGAALLGFNCPWPEALFDWVSMAERSEHSWRGDPAGPLKTISHIVIQRRCASHLSFLRPEHRDELDRITREHCAATARLTKHEWIAQSAEIETQVAVQLMKLAARIAGLTPCPPSDEAVILGMYGGEHRPPNFSHWYLELPTGRTCDGRAERVSCESYPSVPVYFQSPRHDVPTDQEVLPHGCFRIWITGVLPEHLNAIKLALEGYPMAPANDPRRAPSVAEMREQAYGAQSAAAWEESAALAGQTDRQGAPRMTCLWCRKFRGGPDGLCSVCSRKYHSLDEQERSALGFSAVIDDNQVSVD